MPQIDTSSDQTPGAPSAPSSWGAEALAKAVIGGAIEVHRRTGPGLLESVYEACLAYELRNLGMQVRNQVAVPIRYRDVSLDVGYRLDLLVEEQLIVELKCVERIERVHLSQVMTYLRLSNLKVGLLMNFNVPRVADGLRRIVNRYDDAPQPTPHPNLARLARLAFDPKT